MINITSQSQTSRPMPEAAVPPEHLDTSQEQQDVTWDLHNNVTDETGLTTPQNNSQEIQVSQENEGALHKNPPVSAGTSLRGQPCKMSRKMADSVSQRDFYGNAHMHYMASQSLMGETPEDLFHNLHLELEERMRNPIAFHAEMMGDIMYMHQALKQKDASQFVDAVVREINGHVENKHWKLVKRDSVPGDVQIVPSVWSLWCKCNLTTNKITKHKARLNLHGGKQIYGMNYYETYAPVVTWFATRLMIIFGIMFQWSLCQVDFIMAYPQAPIEMDIYMELPQGIKTVEGNSKDHVLKLLKNIYGQKQAGCVWNEYLVERLNSIGFKQSLIDDCVFYHGDTIFMVYVDDGIFIGSSDSQLKNAIKELQDLNFKIEDQGHPADYVGVNISKLKDGSYEFTQRALIDSIIKDVGANDSKSKTVPAKVAL